MDVGKWRENSRNWTRQLVAPGPQLPGKVNYIRGNDQRAWQTGLPTYQSVTYKQVYPGIDAVYRGNQQEFTLVQDKSDSELL